MLKGILFVSVLTLYPIAIHIGDAKKAGKKLPVRKAYIRQMVEQLLLLSFCFAIAPDSFGKLNFDRLGRGIIVDQGVFSGLTTLFYVPLILAFFNIGSLNARREESRLFGYPAELLPRNSRIFWLFALNIVTGVIFEELFFRQLVFYAFNHVFRLHGDWLLLISCALFTIGHSYTKPLEIIFIVIAGIVLGKAFQHSGTILYPIGLHLFLNATLIVLVYKRMKKN